MNGSRLPCPRVVIFHNTNLSPRYCSKGLNVSPFQRLLNWEFTDANIDDSQRKLRLYSFSYNEMPVTNLPEFCEVSYCGQFAESANICPNVVQAKTMLSRILNQSNGVLAHAFHLIWDHIGFREGNGIDNCSVVVLVEYLPAAKDIIVP